LTSLSPSAKTDLATASVEWPSTSVVFAKRDA
jgi:hypothetical protein